MKKIILLLIGIITFTACEKDDICIDENTPHLIIRFYNKEAPTETKNVNKLLVSVEDSNNNSINIGEIATIDSIAIPLNVDIDFTKITFSKNTIDDTGDIDSFTLNYLIEEQFVSRSCGYKVVYADIETSNSTNNWIENSTIINSNIENEAAAHLSIFH